MQDNGQRRGARAVMATMLAMAMAMAPATGKADDFMNGAIAVLLGVTLAQAIIPREDTSGGGSQSFDEVREAPKLRVRVEARAGRLGIATEQAVAPRVWLGIWAGAAGEDGAPTMIFGRMRF